MSEHKHNPYCPYQDDEQLSLFCNCEAISEGYKLPIQEEF